jgi:hypothetical protein
MLWRVCVCVFDLTRKLFTILDPNIWDQCYKTFYERNFLHGLNKLERMSLVGLFSQA